MRGKGRVRHYHVELGGLTQKVEGSHIGQRFSVGVKLRVGDRQRRIKRNLTIRVDVARDQKINSDRRVGVRPWLGVLGVAFAVAIIVAAMPNIAQNKNRVRTITSDISQRIPIVTLEVTMLIAAAGDGGYGFQAVSTKEDTRP